MVYLRRGDDVEGECALVGLARRHGSSVHPYIIISLGESAHHDELLVDDAHTRNAAYHLARILVLRALDVLFRYAGHSHMCLLLFAHQGCLSVVACLARHADNSQCGVVLQQVNVQRLLPFLHLCVTGLRLVAYVADGQCMPAVGDVQSVVTVCIGRGSLAVSPGYAGTYEHLTGLGIPDNALHDACQHHGQTGEGQDAGIKQSSYPNSF